MGREQRMVRCVDVDVILEVGPGTVAQQEEQVREQVVAHLINRDPALPPLRFFVNGMPTRAERSSGRRARSMVGRDQWTNAELVSSNGELTTHRWRFLEHKRPVTREDPLRVACIHCGRQGTFMGPVENDVKGFNRDGVAEPWPNVPQNEFTDATAIAWDPA